MSRCAVRIGSIALVLLALIAVVQSPARADDRLVLRLDGNPIVLTHVRTQGSARAVAADDPGVQALLDRIGATLTWQPGQRYVLFTTAEPVVVSFSIGDARYDVGPVSEAAPFAPFLWDGHPYVPLDEFIHALDFAVKPDGSQLVLQPQLASLDVQASGEGAKLVAHAGMPIDARIVSQSPTKLVVAFDDVGSMLPPSRAVAGGPVQRIDVHTTGTVTHPQTQVTLFLVPGTTHSAPGTDDQRDFTLGFNGVSGTQTVAQSAPEPVESATPAPPDQPVMPASSPSALVQVTDVQTQPQNGSVLVRVSVNGDATYDWHRLRPPDNRWWLDVHNARLAIPPQDEPGADPVTAVRVHQVNPDTVRIALSLSDFDSVDVVPNATGLTITVNSTIADETSVPHSGSGTVGSAAVAQTSGVPENWKFAPRPAITQYVAPNPRLIVIDPGHGGSDPGSEHGGIVEKVVALQISKRLHDILVARGWQVMMTRTDDRDVYQPNDSAHDELQTRDDIANSSGARLFVSVHLNAFINAGPNGATVYYYKPGDLALAAAVDKRIASEVNVKNDGLVKEKLYVIHHANMPATLIEAAYDSNPDDRALLQDPQWQEQMAKAIADGIEDYAGTAPPASVGTGQ
ncbi:MAG TPA: N-acetylmuramoyl-L-alanine amidase [Candidatus Baltobacteraceae bacterium]|nr:N-acetylmuramoyl-L-alanine amidase [Candidatus Baltobacteraceae bacterium]